jgi:choline dehydrogenase-like flavoprotein
VQSSFIAFYDWVDRAEAAMIRSLDDVTAFPHYDLCIVGSGPAGITVCAELMESGWRVCVLESGTETKTEFADSLRKVESHGIQVLPESRERILGGTTHAWVGWSVPLDPVDFAARGWPYHSGWPITWESLVPYLRSAERYGFPPLDAFACAGPFVDNAPAEPRWRNCEEKVFLVPKDISRFGPKYRHLFLKQNVDLILGATVVDLPAERSRAKTRVTAALCRNEMGRKVPITADRFVLAGGAIDNARLLLNSKSIVREGLGNERDQVGRYLMNHPRYRVRLIRLQEPLHWVGRYGWRLYDGGIGFIGVRLREPQQLKEGVLNCCVQILPYHPNLLRQVVLWLMHHLNPRAPMIALLNFVEMEPRPENRITLTDDRDALGMPLPRVVHELSQRDRESLQRLHERIAADLEIMGCGGELVGTPEELVKAEWVDGYHYLGTTRMGIDPEHSVVNPDLRVHTVDNLYVAGGSVFPTSGCANPTMTIVALSIRLAEHLRATSPHPVDRAEAIRPPKRMGN